MAKKIAALCLLGSGFLMALGCNILPNVPGLFSGLTSIFTG